MSNRYTSIVFIAVFVIRDAIADASYVKVINREIGPIIGNLRSNADVTVRRFYAEKIARRDGEEQPL